MCRRLGLNCCEDCAPILERVDTFPSLWPCWRATNSGGGLIPLPGTQWATSGGLLLFTNPGAFFWENRLIGRAVALPVPFTMESIWDMARFTASRTFILAHAQGQTVLNGNAANWTGTSELLVGDPGAVSGSVTVWNGAAVGSTLQAHYRVAVESAIMRHWLWLDGVLPTVTSGPAWGAAVTANTGGWASPPWSVERSWLMRPSGETDFSDVEIRTF